MIRALEDGGTEPSDVNYINAHGTSTKYGDELETSRSIGDRTKPPLIPRGTSAGFRSTKSMTGHLLGAAGGVEAIFTTLAVRDDIAPPTMNLENPDPECDLDYIPNAARKMTINCALTNSFGFGGTNACLLLKKFRN